jgi:hypothetical protein
MSEYQYYEFQAIDRPLGKKEMGELRHLSTRADITPTSFINTYNWGDFRGNVEEVLEKYFDVFFYVANWGTHRLMFRLPRPLVDVEAYSAYCPGGSAILRKTRAHVLLEFCSQDEDGGDWVAGEGELAPLMPVRSDLLAGDWRCLYLGWLLCVQSDDLEEDAVEPAVPPGLRDLSAPLQALVDFLRIDTDLLEVAAEASTSDIPVGPQREEVEEWVRGLPVAQKDAWLIRLAEDHSPALCWEFLQSFRQDRARSAVGAETGPPRRTVADLLAARDARAEERRRGVAEEAARKRERQAQEQARARAQHLDALAKREADAWKQVEALIGTKRPKDYDQAVELLKDLRDLGERAGRKADTEERIGQLRRRHASKPSLMERLRKAGLSR